MEQFEQWKKRHLDSLFLLLKSADKSIYNEQLIGEIWKTWLNSGDKHLNALMQKGLEHLLDSDFLHALLIFSEIIEKRPDYAEAWNKRAIVYYQKGEFKKSIDDIQKTLEIEPRHFGALTGLKTIYTELGELKKALGIIEKMLGMNPYQPVLKQQANDIHAQLNHK